jgi:hypothetical protein
MLRDYVISNKTAINDPLTVENNIFNIRENIIFNVIKIVGNLDIVGHLRDFSETSLRLLRDFFETSLRLLGDFFETSLRLLGDFLETSWRLLGDFLETSWRLLGDFLETSWRLLGDFDKLYARRMCKYFVTLLINFCIFSKKISQVTTKSRSHEEVAKVTNRYYDLPYSREV